MRDIPTIEDLTLALSGITDLLDDRTKLIRAYFSEDKYKDFLMGERLQDIVDADRRDDTQVAKFENASGFDILKQKTTLTKFNNLLTPSAVSSLTLEPIDLTDVAAENSTQTQAQQTSFTSSNTTSPPPAAAPSYSTPSGSTTPPSTSQNQPSQGPQTKLAKGGVVFPNFAPNVSNSFNYPFTQTNTSNTFARNQDPEVMSLEKAGFAPSSPGKKSPLMGQISEDLGFDELRKSLAESMKLIPQSVAAGLLGLLGSLPVPEKSPFRSAFEGTVGKLANAFQLPNTGIETLNLGIFGQQQKSQSQSGSPNQVTVQSSGQSSPPMTPSPDPASGLPSLPPGSPGPQLPPPSSSTSAGPTPRHQGPVSPASPSTSGTSSSNRRPQVSPIFSRGYGNGGGRAEGGLGYTAEDKRFAAPASSVMNMTSESMNDMRSNAVNTVISSPISSNITPYTDSTSYTSGDNFFNLTESVMLEQQEMIAEKSNISSMVPPIVTPKAPTFNTNFGGSGISLQSDVEVSQYFLTSVNQSPFV